MSALKYKIGLVFGGYRIVGSGSGSGSHTVPSQCISCGIVREVQRSILAINKYGCRACSRPHVKVAVKEAWRAKKARRLAALGDDAYKFGLEPGHAVNSIHWQNMEPSSIRTLDDFQRAYCPTNQIGGAVYAAEVDPVIPPVLESLL